jgi:hypothetical protein
VEGTIDPTPALSPDAKVHGILPAGLKKEKQSSLSKAIR